MDKPVKPGSSGGKTAFPLTRGKKIGQEDAGAGWQIPWDQAQAAGEAGNEAAWDLGERMQAAMERFSPGLISGRQVGPKEGSSGE